MSPPTRPIPAAQGCSEPHVHHFPAYGKRETLAIIQRDRPAGAEPRFFEQYAEMLWSVFHGWVWGRAWGGGAIARTG